MNPLLESTETILACPIDGGALSCRAKTLTCAEGHSFDIAKRGYINLLPVQHKRSKYPGDSKEMVLARKQFLASGHYEPIAQELAQLCLPLLAEKQTQGMNPVVIDAGCGEGYYLNYLRNQGLNNGNAPPPLFYGFDISKEAIHEACKCSRDITWLVASNRQPPFLNHKCDLLVCMFGFPVFSAFSKLLKPSASMLLVEPGPKHLQELRELIYDEQKPNTKTPGSAIYEHNGFLVKQKHSLTYQTGKLDNENSVNLLTMTPHFYRMTAEKKALATQLQTLFLTIDIEFTLIQASSSVAT